MSKIKSKTVDPENYSNMVIPYESNSAADEALSKFYEELGELRKKHKIPDLLIVTQGSLRQDDGTVTDFMNLSSYGNSLNQLPMAAYAYGQTKADHDYIISKLASGSIITPNQSITTDADSSNAVG